MSLLAPDIRDVLKDRGCKYGKFEDHAAITQGLKGVMHNHIKWMGLSDDKKEALEMAAHKIGRIINGDPEYLDSWVDIIGYTQLVIDRIRDGTL